MTRTPYQRGADMERRVRHRLEEQGWTVFRTAGSKSPCDLLAVRGSYSNIMDIARERDPDVFEWLFVQVKSGQRPMPRKDREAFRQFALNHGARPLLVSRGMTFRWLDELEEKAA